MIQLVALPPDDFRASTNVKAFGAIMAFLVVVAGFGFCLVTQHMWSWMHTPIRVSTVVTNAVASVRYFGHMVPLEAGV